MSSRGVTLLEMLVALAVVGVLAVLGFSSFERMREGGRSAACLGNLRQLGVALNLFLADHQMVLPDLPAGRESVDEDLPAIDTVLAPYVGGFGVFACPADRKGIAAATGTSYIWNSTLSGEPVASLSFFGIESPSRIPLLGDKEGFHRFRENRANILYADGHASGELHFVTGQ